MGVSYAVSESFTYCKLRDSDSVILIDFFFSGACQITTQIKCQMACTCLQAATRLFQSTWSSSISRSQEYYAYRSSQQAHTSFKCKVACTFCQAAPVQPWPVSRLSLPSFAPRNIGLTEFDTDAHTGVYLLSHHDSLISVNRGWHKGCLMLQLA